MDLNFPSIVDFVASYFFGGSSTLAGLALLVAAWAVCLVLLMNMKASPAYSVMPMIPLAIFFSAYGILNETIMILIVLVSAALVANELKKVVS
jgi:hypothetical protein